MKMRGIKMKNKAFIIAMICLTIICISPIFIGQWLIQRQAEGNPNYDAPTVQSCTCGIKTEVTYTGVAQPPQSNADLIAVLGDGDFETYNSDGSVSKAGIAFQDVSLKFASSTGFTDTSGNAITATSANFKAGSTTITWNDIKWKWAGEYTFKIVDNVTGQVLCPHHTLKIKQASAQGNVSVNSATSYYKQDISYTVTWTGVNNETTSYSATLTAPTGDKLTENNFTANSLNTTNHPTWCNNYSFSAPTGQYSLLPVAKIGSTQYATINRALTSASSGNTVNVLILGSTVDNGVAKDAKTITTTIKSGVTLYVNYADSTSSAYSVNNPDTKLTASGIVCQNRVFIGSAITNNGTITVPAQVTGLQSTGISMHKNGTSSTGGASSIVYGNYSVIECLSGGSITSTGTINCYGYIEGNVTLDGGTMTTLFSHNEHRGGTALTNMISMPSGQKSFPVKRYWIGSVNGTIRVNQGASLVGHIFIKVSIVERDTTVVMISPNSASSKGLIGLETGSYATLSYDKTKNQYAQVANVYGSASINDITVSIEGLSFIVDDILMKTTDSFLPFSYIWDIGLYALTDDNGTIIPATVSTGSNDIALLPGARCTVGEGVTLNAHNIALYTDYTELNKNVGGVKYGTNYQRGELIVYGTLNANAIGGVVTAGKQSAKITYSSNQVVSYEPSSATEGDTDGDGDPIALTHTLTGQIVQNTTTAAAAPTSVSETLPTSGTYIGMSLAGSSNCAWRPETITITMHRNDGTTTTQTVGPTTINANGYDVSQLSMSRDYYTFKPWHNDAGVELKRLYKNTDIYAQWEVITYELSYSYSIPSGETVDPGISTAYYKITDVENEDTVLALPNHEDYARPEGISDACTLAGWFDGSTPVSASEFTFKKLTQLAGSDKALTLTGKWTEKFYTIEFNVDGNPYGITEITHSTNPTLSFALGYHYEGDSIIQNQVAMNDGITTDETKKYYFAGWYVDTDGDGTAETHYTTAYAPEVDGFTLYATWGTKATLTVDYGDNVLDYDGETVYIMPDATYTLQDITAGDDDTTKSLYSHSWAISGNVTVDGTTATLNCTDNATVTLTANWLPKVLFTISYGTPASGATFTAIDDRYFIPGTVVDISAPMQEALKYDDTSSINKYFGLWSITGEGTLNDTAITLNSGSTVALTAQWLDKVNLIIDYDHDNFDNRSDLYFKPGASAYIPDYIVDVTAYDHDPLVNKYFDVNSRFEVTAGNAEIVNMTNLEFAEDATGSVTLTAKWLEKTTTLTFTANENYYTELFSGFDADFAYGKTYYFHPDDTTVTLPDVTGYDNDTGKQYYFDGWSVSTTPGLDHTLSEGANTINITWGEKYSITINANAMHSYISRSCAWTLAIYLNDSTEETVSYSMDCKASGEQAKLYFSPKVKIRLYGTVTGYYRDGWFSDEYHTVGITGGTSSLSVRGSSTESGTIFDGYLTGNLTIANTHSEN